MCGIIQKWGYKTLLLQLLSILSSNSDPWQRFLPLIAFLHQCPRTRTRSVNRERGLPLPILCSSRTTSFSLTILISDHSPRQAIIRRPLVVDTLKVYFSGMRNGDEIGGRTKKKTVNVNLSATCLHLLLVLLLQHTAVKVLLSPDRCVGKVKATLAHAPIGASPEAHSRY